MARRQYPFHLIEPKWQGHWEAEQTFRAWNPGDVLPVGHPFAVRHGLAGQAADHRTLPPKCYILDMFPYPSGAGLHVGHPEGYTATDILSRYRRALGFNVLHPMGWDAFGLPAEQYAVKTGQHPRKTTEENVATFKRQIRSLGFSYDWTREVATTDPEYFRWTQWIFLQLYHAWFNPETNRAEPISTLPYPDACDTPAAKRAFRDSKRLAYVNEAPVNWCPELGTVLANEEVIDGKSEVGGFPVIRKPMRQWMLRITAYAERLLADLETIEWSDSLKEMQRNWIGRSEGATVKFSVFSIQYSEGDVELAANDIIEVFTTRPDTLFGATYMVLSPEHRLVEKITTREQKQAVQDYQIFAAGRSDLQRTELSKEKTGVFTGAYAINPVNGDRIPVWIADYVLASYGTGAIMAVPGHDTRDLEFAQKFNLPVVQVVQPTTNEDWHGFTGQGTAVNSTAGELSLDGLPTVEAKKKITAWLESKSLGRATVTYKLRDWLFSRQRYWGEPFPIVWKEDADGARFHEAIPAKNLPVLPPALEDYKPTPDGQPPLARANDWVQLRNGARRETNTMPQWAGSCWYYLRYLDSQNDRRFVSREAERYWMGSNRPAGMLPLISPADWPSIVHDLVRRAYAAGPRPPHGIEYAAVSHALAEQVHQLCGLDVSEYRHSLDVYAVRHVLEEHGGAAVEELRGNLGITLSDFEQLPEIVADPDSIQFDGTHKPGFKRLISSKRLNGTVYVVEEAHTRAGQLQLVTLWKRKATAKDVTAKAPPSSTSENDRRNQENETGAPQPVKPTPGVDLYVGGTEHAVLHLLYARFWHKVLYDLGHVSTIEPFFKLVNQGLILGEDGQKMSKSRGNVVNPDDILKEYGADAFRLYEMFLGPLPDVKPWNTHGVAGVYKFLGRVWRLFLDEASETAFEQSCAADPANAAVHLAAVRLAPNVQDIPADPFQLKPLHACIKKVTEDLEALRFNTAIAAMMIFVNEAIVWEVKPVAVLKIFLQLLAPFAPHLAEELWSKLHSRNATLTEPSLGYAPWPKFDPALLVEDTLEIPVQVNGKLREVIRIPAAATNAELETAALKAEKVQPFLAGKTVRKVIVVPRKLVNIAVS